MYILDLVFYRTLFLKKLPVPPPPEIMRYLRDGFRLDLWFNNVIPPQVYTQVMITMRHLQFMPKPQLGVQITTKQ